MKSFVKYCVVSLLLTIVMPSFAEEWEPSNGLYAVIEVGSKGVKGHVFDLDRAENDSNCSKDEDTYIICLNPKLVEPLNTNPINDKDGVETSKAVATIVSALISDQIKPERIYPIGSSGLANGNANFENIRSAVNKNPQLQHEMKFVTPEEEALYLFGGVIDLVPKVFREKRRKSSLVIDIGSGNVKGAFLEVAGNRKRMVAFEIPWGTKTATDLVNRERGTSSFSDAAPRIINERIAPDIRSALDDKQGSMNRQRIYLAGGISWSLSNITQPTSTLKFPPVRPGDIAKFNRMVFMPDASQKICAEHESLSGNKQIDKICTVFSMNNLMAGGQILNAFEKELDFSHKSVFFIRESIYAWPYAYLRSIVSGD